MFSLKNLPWSSVRYDEKFVPQNEVKIPIMIVYKIIIVYKILSWT